MISNIIPQKFAAICAKNVLQLESIKWCRRGVTSLEYALIGAVIVAVGLASFSPVGTKVSSRFNSVKNVMS